MQLMISILRLRNSDFG